MSNLEDLLAAEEEVYRREERILRQFAVNVRGLRDEHIEPLVQMHLKDCADYFREHGTVNGSCSPWMTGQQEDV